ncbi:MAG TPA: hypothetical protein VN455_01245, partial [Methanotrichaceae archaeon]|nr:hypothetical protein [Methanotrichaceae archaeon]
MNALRIALISMICILAQVLAACAVELSETGTNTVTGAAIVQGDIFALQPSPDTLYSGMWAHVYIPEGNDGVNAGSSKRTVLARTESRPAGSVNEYTLKTGYGDSTVTAEASKSGALGTAEAFSEVSAVSVAYDGNSTDEGGVYGIAALTAYISHTGTGTANASANGSADYEALMNNSVIQASGSVAGSAALGAANSYGGTVTGTALKVSESTADSLSAAPYADSECYGYISLQSGRNTLSAESTIHGNVSGSSSGMGLTVMPGTPGMNASSQSSTEGNLFAVASTYKIGDSIKPGEITAHTFYSDMITRLDDLTAAETGAKTPLYEQLLNGSTTKASAYLLSHSWSCYSSNNSSSAPPHQSFAQTESFTSAGVTRELNDANAAYGVSYISNGALSTDAYTSSAGNSPITLASAGVEEIKMGSGARLVGRLTGASPASTADLTVE